MWLLYGSQVNHSHEAEGGCLAEQLENVLTSQATVYELLAVT